MPLEENFNERIQRGDVKAFETLFSSHYVKLTLFANRFLNDLAASEEIVSDVFAGLWEKRNTFIINTSIQSYLYKMTQNKCLNFIKHKKVENEYIGYLVRNNLLDDFHRSWNPYLTKELEDQAKKAIEKLPEKCREVFKLSRFEHLKNREIAQRLNISPKTVERQITIALEKLRAYLKHSLYSLFL